jgi:anti-sigma B factor antagonist
MSFTATRGAHKDMNTSFTLTKEDAAVQAGEATVRIDHSSPEPTIVVTGRVTVASSPRLRSAVFELIFKNAWRALVIDLSSVSHIDISGLATLLEGVNWAHGHSIRLRLVGVNGQPRRLAELAQMDEIYRALGSEVELS